MTFSLKKLRGTDSYCHVNLINISLFLLYTYVSIVKHCNIGMLNFLMFVHGIYLLLNVPLFSNINTFKIVSDIRCVFCLTPPPKFHPKKIIKIAPCYYNYLFRKEYWIFLIFKSYSILDDRYCLLCQEKYQYRLTHGNNQVNVKSLCIRIAYWQWFKTSC